MEGQALGDPPRMTKKGNAAVRQHRKLHYIHYQRLQLTMEGALSPLDTALTAYKM